MLLHLRSALVALLSVLIVLVFAPEVYASEDPGDGDVIYLPIVTGKPVKPVDPSGQQVTFWHQHSGDREAALLKSVNAFNADNPWGITVVAENQGSYGDIYNKMLTVLNTQDAPDLVVAYQNQAALYQTADALVDMRPLVGHAVWGLSDAEKADFFPSVITQDLYPEFGGQRLGFPAYRAMEILYYNDDWLAQLGYSEPPTNTVGFQEAACAAAKTPFQGTEGVNNMGYMLTDDASRFASWVFAFGGQLYDSGTQRYTLDSRNAIEAMTYLQGLFDLGCAVLAEERFEDQTAFGAGEVLFTMASSSGIPFYRSAVEASADFAWRTGVLPYTTDKPVTNLYGPSLSMPKHTAESELAVWLFLKHFTSTGAQDEWVRASNYFPVRQSVATELADFFADNPQYSDAFGYLPYGHSEPVVAGYDFVRSLISEAMVDIVLGEDVASRLRQLNIDANAVLAAQAWIN